MKKYIDTWNQKNKTFIILRELSDIIVCQYVEQDCKDKFFQTKERFAKFCLESKDNLNEYLKDLNDRKVRLTEELALYRESNNNTCSFIIKSFSEDITSFLKSLDPNIVSVFLKKEEHRPYPSEGPPTIVIEILTLSTPTLESKENFEDELLETFPFLSSSDDFSHEILYSYYSIVRLSQKDRQKPTRN